MLPKDSLSKRSRISPNSSNLKVSKLKVSSVQTEDTNYFHVSNEETCIGTHGEIPRDVQDDYKKAVDYVNKWNNLMNEYLKNERNKNGYNKVEGCQLIDDLRITTIPNFMAFFFSILQKLDNQCTDSKIPKQKNSSAQTSYFSEKNYSKSRNSLVLPEIEENLSDSENMPTLTRNIQESQYKNYPTRYQHSTTPSIGRSSQIKNKNERNICSTQKHTARHSEGNIRKTASNIFRKDSINDCMRTSKSTDITSTQNFTSNTTLRRNQSSGSFSTTPSSVLQQKRPLTGLLSTNGMIASKINAKGTPLIVKHMFEEVQHPVGVFVSKGNILKHIARDDDSSSSSVILSDKESRELKVSEVEERERLGIRPSYHMFRKEVEYPEEISPNPHPLTLNGRDLMTRNKSFINSIGIFTEAGELKPNAKTYLEKKEDVKKSPFRAPRVSQIHMTKNYVKSCTSESLLSDNLSPQSSDIRSDD